MVLFALVLSITHTSTYSSRTLAINRHTTSARTPTAAGRRLQASSDRRLEARLPLLLLE